MITEWLRRTLAEKQRSKWDREYAAGRWDYFNDPLEEDRYAAILSFTDRYFRGGGILEVGCGEGILQERMKKGNYSRFLGIDVSKVAIRKAMRLKDDATDYRYGDMERFVPSWSPDLVIFNEVIYYSPDPIRLLRRYAGFLRPDGIIICSCFETERSLKIMEKIEEEFRVVDQKVSANVRGTWHCRAYSKLLSALLFLLLGWLPFAGHAQNRVDHRLESMLRPLVDSFHGIAGVYVRNLKTGREAAINADTIFPTASIIKVPILVGIFQKMQQDTMSYHQPLVYRDTMARKGSGLMQYYKDGDTTDLQTAITLMITHSDNTAAVWCERMAGGGPAINAWLDAHGFQQTRLNNRTPGREKYRDLYGWGQTTPREMARLVTMIRNGEVVSPASSQVMYRIMTHVFWDAYALSQIPPYIQAASKQGMVDASRSEVVLVNAPHGDYVFYVATKDNKDQRWVPDNEAWRLARNVSALLWNYFEPRLKWTPAPGAEKFW